MNIFVTIKSKSRHASRSCHVVCDDVAFINSCGSILLSCVLFSRVAKFRRQKRQTRCLIGTDSSARCTSPSPQRNKFLLVTPRVIKRPKWRQMFASQLKVFVLHPSWCIMRLRPSVSQFKTLTFVILSTLPQSIKDWKRWQHKQTVEWNREWIILICDRGRYKSMSGCRGRCHDVTMSRVTVTRPRASQDTLPSFHPIPALKVTLIVFIWTNSSWIRDI